MLIPKDVSIIHDVFYKVCLYFLLLFFSFSICSGRFLAVCNEVGEGMLLGAGLTVLEEAASFVLIEGRCAGG